MRLCIFLLLATSAWTLPRNEPVQQNIQKQVLNQEQPHETAERDCSKTKCASSIAQKAAAEARAAQAAQNAAGAQAAHMVKTQLAEKALQAAKAAEAALAGKQAVVEQLQQEVRETEAVVAMNLQAVHQQQGTVAAACQLLQQASAQVKTQLAEKALQAAKAAEAALAGKQAVVEQLQQEVRETEAVVAMNLQAVHQQQGTVAAACQLLQQASAQHKLMIQGTQVAAQVEKSAQCVVERTKAGLAEKCKMLSEARARLAHLQHQLQCACADCNATRQAAHIACEAARGACGNAKRRKKRIIQRALAARDMITRGH